MKKIAAITVASAIICATSYSAEFLPIETTGNYTVSPGDYTASSSWIVDSYGKNIVVNVGEDGLGNVNLDTQNTVWVLDSYGNYDSKQGGGSITWNGNLSLSMRTSYNDFKPILSNDGSSSLTVNGDLSVKAQNTGATSSHNTFLVTGEFYSHSKFNGSLDLSASTVNSSGASIGSAVTVLRGEGVDMSFGGSSTDKIWIHDIKTNAVQGAESYGIYGYNYGGYNLNYTINVEASAIIENISADSTASYSYAAAAEVHGGSLSFNGDLTIRNIKAETAFALASYNGGSISVNEANSRSVKIEGDIDALGSGSSIDIKLSNAESYIRGAINSGDGAQVSISVAEGSSLYLTGNSSFQSLSIDGGSLIVEGNAALSYNSNLIISGDSSLIFYAINDVNFGKILLGDSAELEISDTLSVELILGDYFRDLNSEYSLLLIDAEGIVESEVLALENAEGSFLWSDDGKLAEGWSLEFVEGKGLYAVYAAVPEPATCAVILGALALLVAAYYKRR